MAEKCTIKDCGKNASYGIVFMKGIYCRQHGIEMGAKPKQKICMCGSAAPTYGKEEDTRPSCCIKCKTADVIKLQVLARMVKRHIVSHTNRKVWIVRTKNARHQVAKHGQVMVILIQVPHIARFIKPKH